MTPWQKILESRQKNIGFLTRIRGFGEPTPTEKASALAQEIKSWQATKGSKPYTVSAEYSIPQGYGINLKRTREPGGRLDVAEYTKAISAYVVTPMDHHDILKAQGIDVSRYERPPTILERIKDWINSLIDPDFEPRTRLTKEFIEQFKVGEKK